MTTCQQCQQTFGANELFGSSSGRKTRPKPNQNRVSILHKDLFSRWTLSPSPPKSTQRNTPVTKLPVSRLSKQDLQAQRPPTTPPAKLPYPTKGHQSKQAICNASIFSARGQCSKRTVCGGTFPVKHRSRRAICGGTLPVEHRSRRAVCDRSIFPARGYWTKRAVCGGNFHAGDRTFWLNKWIF